MARSSECTEQYAQKVFDSAGIVRDAIFYQVGQGRMLQTRNSARHAAQDLSR